jgi:hypothetical protein
MIFKSIVEENPKRKLTRLGTNPGPLHKTGTLLLLQSGSTLLYIVKQCNGVLEILIPRNYII